MCASGAGSVSAGVTNLALETRKNFVRRRKSKRVRLKGQQPEYRRSDVRTKRSLAAQQQRGHERDVGSQCTASFRALVCVSGSSPLRTFP